MFSDENSYIYIYIYFFPPARKARELLLDMLKTIFFSNNCKVINKTRSWGATTMEGLKECVEQHRVSQASVARIQCLARACCTYIFCGSPEK